MKNDAGRARFGISRSTVENPAEKVAADTLRRTMRYTCSADRKLKGSILGRLSGTAEALIK